MGFSAEKLRLNLQRLNQSLGSEAPIRRYVIAFSGGLDSSVMVHALAALRSQLHVELQTFHVDHALQSMSRDWAARCEKFSSSKNIAYFSVRVDARPGAGESPEAAARKARYAAFAAHMGPGDCLLTAHHRDDQAETVLLQLLRGAGPRGLAAMPGVATFGRGLIMRPLLDFSREELHAYAVAAGLDWIDDPSNFDVGYERNFLRREILPRLLSRWPAAATTISRSAVLCAEAVHLLDEVADHELATVAGPVTGTLWGPSLRRLDGPKRRSLLMAWLRRLGLPGPSRAQLQRIELDVLGAAADGSPRVTWPGVEVRRYRDCLYASPPLSEPPPEQAIAWSFATPLVIPGAGTLTATPAVGMGLRQDLGNVRVGFRGGGERCEPAGRRGSHAVKKLFQEYGVAPWLRNRTPLIFVESKVAAIADLCVCEPFQAGANEAGWRLHWQPAMRPSNVAE